MLNGKFKRSQTSDPNLETTDWVGFRFTHVKTGLHFQLSTSPMYMSEVQRSRLLLHYCQFDPRIKPLLGIVHLWAIVNNIRIDMGNIKPKYSYNTVPDPGALEWLVVFFLCDKGLIPTPRELQSQPHKQLVLQSGQLLSFCEDPHFVADWIQEHSQPLQNNNPDKKMMDIITLAQEFFTFSLKIVSISEQGQGIVLNTRDAEILRRDVIRRCHDKKVAASLTNKLTLEEVAAIHEEMNKDIYNSRRIAMLHPFNVKWKFSVNDKHLRTVVAPIMRSAQAELQSFLDKRNTDWRPSPEINSISLKDLLDFAKCKKRNERK